MADQQTGDDVEARNAAFFARLDQKIARLTPSGRQRRINKLMRRAQFRPKDIVEWIALTQQVAAERAAAMMMEKLRSGELKMTGIRTTRPAENGRD